ncbi:hypothetical protein Ancab_009188 [Ancistrocladus abbreviatus]
MSTVGVELSNFINPNLTWKTSRRSRRLASNLKMGQEQGNRSSKRVEAPQVSDSEKPQAVVSHHRLSDNIEHIPIKKRRFLLRSPSPPPQSSYSLKDSEELHDSCCDVDRQISMYPAAEQGDVETSSNATEPLNSVSDGDVKNLKSRQVQGCNEDFSGIAILADAACSDSLKNTAGDARRSQARDVVEQEQNESASKMNHIEPIFIELSDPSGKAHDNVDASLNALSNDAHEVMDDAKRASGASSDDRFHWDLNVAMDEWERPLDETTVPSGLNLVEDTTLDTLHRQKCDDMEGCDAQKESGKIESGNELTFQCSVCKLNMGEMQSVSTVFACGTPEFRTQETALEGSSVPERSLLNDDFPSASCSHPMETSNLVLDSEVNGQVDNRITTTNHTLCLQPDDMKTWLSTDNQKTDSNKVVKEESASGVQVGEPVKSSMKMTALGEITSEACEITSKHVEPSLFVEKHESAFSHASGSGSATREANNAICNDKDHGERNDLNDSEEEVAKVSCQSSELHPLGGVAVVSESKEVATSHSLSKSEDTGASFVASGSEPVARTIEVTEILDKTCVVDASRCDHSLVSGSEVLMQTGSEHHTADGVGDGQLHSPSNQSSKVSLRDGLEGGLYTHVSHDGRSHIGSSTELDGGYDSHLEDGELREPVEIFWEENEAEEAEHVDYDSDNRDGYEAPDAANDSLTLPRKVLVGVDGERRSQSDQCGYKDDRPSSEKSTGENSCRSCPGSLSTADTECLRRKSSASSTGLIGPFKEMDDNEGVGMCLKRGRKSSVGSDDLNKGENEASENLSKTQRATEVAGLTASRRELQSQIEGPSSSDRKDDESSWRSRSSNLDYMYDGDGRQTDADESLDKGRTSLHMDGRNRLHSHSWNFSLKSAVANSATESDGERFFRASGDTSPRVRRPTIISTSKSGYPHLVRKGLLPERDDEYGMGKVKVREISPDNTIRSRFDRYPVGINRGYREGYRRPGVYETANTLGTMRNHFGKRERSFSPIINRMDHLPQGHRRSRSRSRSRSPDFRSEARTGRMRIPYQPAAHVADHVRERRSPGRMFCQSQRFDTVGSPGRLRPDDCLRPMVRPVRFSDMAATGRNHEYVEGDDYKRRPHLPRSHRRSHSRSRSRSPEFRSEARMGTMRLPYHPRATNHIRDRRSPVRVFRPGQRFDTMDSQGRMRTDDYLRPVMRPIRFPDAAQSGRGNEYDGDDFRRKPRRIFERIHPIRHYDMDGERRFQYEAEDVDVAQGFRTADRRSGDVLRNTREERGSTRYNSDRIYYSGPKPLAMRDYVDDTQPRTIRP